MGGVLSTRGYQRQRLQRTTFLGSGETLVEDYARLGPGPLVPDHPRPRRTVHPFLPFSDPPRPPFPVFTYSIFPFSLPSFSAPSRLPSLPSFSVPSSTSPFSSAPLLSLLSSFFVPLFLFSPFPPLLSYPLPSTTEPQAYVVVGRKSGREGHVRGM